MSDPMFQVARIVYFTDMTCADAHVIPLGVFAECRTDRMKGLGLKARSSLSEKELAQISPLLRDALADPFAYFRTEFNDVWTNARAGEAIARLAAKHSSSLAVLAPSDCEEKGWLGSRAIHPRPEAVEEKLLAAVRNEFEKLEKELGVKDVDQELTVRKAQLADAA